MMNRVKTKQEIDAMRHGGRILAAVLDIIQARVRAGMTPQDISAIAKQELKNRGGTPAFLGFENYPDIICISVNNEVQHAIPSKRPFNDGDVVNFDFGVRYGGMVTDGGVSLCIGNRPNKDQARLLQGTAEALEAGIAIVKAGVQVGDISAAIEKVLRSYKLSIVRDLVGHGVGHELHEEPNIPNFGKAGTGARLQAGMTIAIEPITTLGRPDIFTAHDGWTLLTVDGSLSAQFEHTVLVTETGSEILTRQ
jgi:methionyl aminopeptidase